MMRCKKKLEREHIEMLRKEANEVKDCFTRYAFQAMITATLAFVAIIEFQPKNFFVGYSGIVVSYFLLNISRIGLHKYTTANRHFGYQLHLERTRHLHNSNSGGWHKRMRKIGWEEALRAWRIVQATCFQEVYKTSSDFWPKFLSRLASYTYKYDYKKMAKNSQIWFDIDSLVAKTNSNSTRQVVYYPGDYLRAQLRLIHLTSLAFLIPPIAAIVQLEVETNVPPWVTAAIGAIIFLHALNLIYRIWVRGNRTKILEKQLLSIHSCAIMWQAVVVAHYLALKVVHNDPHSIGYDGYTSALRDQAQELASNLKNIHKWVVNPNFPSAGFAGEKAGLRNI